MLKLSLNLYHFYQCIAIYGSWFMLCNQVKLFPSQGSFPAHGVATFPRKRQAQRVTSMYNPGEVTSIAEEARPNIPVSSCVPSVWEQFCPSMAEEAEKKGIRSESETCWLTFMTNVCHDLDTKRNKMIRQKAKLKCASGLIVLLMWLSERIFLVFIFLLSLSSKWY